VATHDKEVRVEWFRARLALWIARTRLVPAKVRFRKMTRLWAVCKPDGSITFAIALLDQPPAFQELVIVHELVHLLIPDHGPHFQRLLVACLPDCRAVARLAPESPALCKTRYGVEDRVRSGGRLVHAYPNSHGWIDCSLHRQLPSSRAQ
jgi:predicted metal-dependent hydrolase